MKTLRIGTRDSALAVWQAATVARALEAKGYKTELVEVKSAGDLDLSTPLSQLGSTGVFTKILDEALYQDKADIAVHSLKDYPTQAPEGIVMAAVLERGPVEDILVHKGNLDFLNHSEGKVATGSIRRIAQWKARYPEHDNPGLRGNVQTRLQKLADNDWHGAIFAKAGLERLNLLPEHYEILDWMIPAPAQGIVGITCLESKSDFQEILREINHENTALRAKVERDFLRTVEGGCSAPVGAYAQIEENQIRLQAGVFSLNGKEKVRLENAVPLSAASELGISMAQEALKLGAAAILEKIKHD